MDLRCAIAMLNSRRVIYSHKNSICLISPNFSFYGPNMSQISDVTPYFLPCLLGGCWIWKGKGLIGNWGKHISCNIGNMKREKLIGYPVTWWCNLMWKLLQPVEPLVLNYPQMIYNDSHHNNVANHPLKTIPNDTTQIDGIEIILLGLWHWLRK